MAKTIDISDDSTDTLKQGDTTSYIRWVCGNDNLPASLSDATSITVKIISSKNGTMELAKSLDLAVSDQEDLGDGIVKINFTDDVMSSLDPGTYDCEIHVTTPDGVSIYPTVEYVDFTINPSF